MTNTARKLLLGLLGGSSSFSPLSIPGLLLWAESRDTATLFQNSNGTTAAAADTNPVGYWRDKSGNGYNVLQATANRRPTRTDNALNSEPGILFDGLTDGTGDVMGVNFTASGAQTRFVVFKMNTVEASKTIVAAYADPAYYQVGSHITATTLRMSSGANLDVTSSGNDTFAIWCFEFNGATSRMFKSGQLVASGSAGTNAQGGLTIGGNPYYNLFGSSPTSCAHMTITDIALYSGVLSDANRNGMGAWLAAKTGLNFTAS
jgi:hypothetical protein